MTKFRFNFGPFSPIFKYSNAEFKNDYSKLYFHICPGLTCTSGVPKLMFSYISHIYGCWRTLYRFWKFVCDVPNTICIVVYWCKQSVEEKCYVFSTINLHMYFICKMFFFCNTLNSRCYGSPPHFILEIY